MKIKALTVKTALTALLAVTMLSCFFLPAQPVTAAPSVTLTLYVYMYGADPKITPALPGVLVTGKDGNGIYFSQATNAFGYVTLTGAPGVWSITLSDSGYQTSGPSYTSVLATTALQSLYLHLTKRPPAFLIRQGPECCGSPGITYFPCNTFPIFSFHSTCIIFVLKFFGHV